MAGGPCLEAGCACSGETFRMNPFKRGHCKACGHKHAEVAAAARPKKKWTVETTSSYSFPFATVEPHSAPLDKIDWTSAVGVQKSEGGSQGVFFVELPQGAVVVKGSMGVASEVFASILASSLQLSVPKCRLIVRASKEGTTMYDTLVGIDERQPIYRTVHSALHRTYLLVMEFVKGKTLGALDARTAPQYFAPNVPDAARALHDLGEVLAFDMLMHNTDRLPLVVDNRGNAGNIFLAERKGYAKHAPQEQKGAETFRLVAIDNVSSSIDPKKNAATMITYLTKCAELLRWCKEKPGVPSAQCVRIRDSIFEHTHFDIDECGGGGGKAPSDRWGTLQVQRGIIAFIDRIRRVTIKQIMHCKQRIAALGAEMVGLDDVRSDFLFIMLNLFHCDGDFGGVGKTASDFIAACLRKLPAAVSSTGCSTSAGAGEVASASAAAVQVDMLNQLTLQLKNSLES